VQTYREHIWRRTDYEALFADAPPGTLRGESTPFYLYDRDAQRRISELIPRVKMIVILRDPVERANSNWTHLWSAGLEPIGDFVRACAEEDARAAAGWAPFWHYTRLGRYAEQLEHLFLRFPREQVCILRYRALLDTPALALDDICEFLGVHRGIIARVPRENVTAQPSGSLTHRAVARLARRAPPHRSARPGPGGQRALPAAGRFLQQNAGQRLAAVLGTAAGRAAPTSRTTSGSSSTSPAPTSATGCSPGSAPAGWSALSAAGQSQARNGPPLAQLRRSSWAPSGRSSRSRYGASRRAVQDVEVAQSEAGIR
jgi:hypothetical protein